MLVIVEATLVALRPGRLVGRQRRPPVLLRGSADRLALSYREREVLRLVIAGNTNSEIADSLFLAQSTVKSHLSSAYRKLGRRTARTRRR